jgi:glycosyltransferase involved in cell wall biosynthesis
MTRGLRRDGFRVLTWHVHGSYLDALARTGHHWFIPVSEERRPGYTPAWPSWDPEVVTEVPVDRLPDLEVDAILFQNRLHWEEDQWTVLSPEQRRLPRVYVEHDPPREHPTDTRHVVDDPNVLLVHVTPFNRLMWDSGPAPAVVIDHGLAVPEHARYTGRLERGIVVINDLATRGRRLGLDLYLDAAAEVPLDLVGMDSQRLGGLGEVGHDDLPAFESRYRFYFHPVRWTSLGLSLIEAMHVGMPIVALATTEVPTIIEDGISGIASTDPSRLIEGMRELLRDPGLAEELGRAGQAVARERFSIERFARDWTAALERIVGRRVGATVSYPVPPASTATAAMGAR